MTPTPRTNGLRIGALRVVQGAGCPDEVFRAVLPHVKRWVWLAPSWCHELHVFHDNDDGEPGDSLSMCAQYGYRFAQLNVRSEWLGNDDATRGTEVLHEILHIVLAPAQQFGDGIIEKAIPAAMRAWVEASWHEAIESATCDLERALAAREE